MQRVRAFYLADLGRTPDELAELNAAARELELAGKIRIATIGVDRIVYRPADGVPDPMQVARLSRK